MMKVLTWALEEPFKKEEMVTHQVGLLQRLHPRYVLLSGDTSFVFDLEQADFLAGHLMHEASEEFPRISDWNNALKVLTPLFIPPQPLNKCSSF